MANRETPPVTTPPGNLPSTAVPGAEPAHRDVTQSATGWGLLALGLGALGVVYGDIGTSPLYAFKECFLPHGGHVLAQTRENVLGLLSLFFWSLTLVVSVKYLVFVLRADNNGEGGILALLSLVAPRGKPERRTWTRALLIGLGLIGASLLASEGMITPAISVLSAIEGLGVATTRLQNVVVPITVVILIALFLVQKRGTAGIAAIFGPAMLVWFSTIAVLGVLWIVRRPEVLAAVSPWYALLFFVSNKLHGFLILGAVVLCITGAEALYADLGHFGRRPIRLAWYGFAFPALLLNYFGQGAYVLARGPLVIGNPEAPFNPFYALAPGWFLYPLVVIATTATVVASQALISGAFSLAQQAVQMGYSPRLTIVHTSSEARGQIYVPEVNTALMVACVALVLAFRESSGLAAAYGVSVMSTMTITSLLLFAVMTRRWGWTTRRAGALIGVFLFIDLSFLGANLTKIASGGWFPLVVGAGIFTLMTTWKTGRALLYKSLRDATLPLEKFLSALEREPPHRVPGTAVFMTSNPEGTPVVLMHHFKHNKVLHERVILLTVESEDVPEVPPEQRVAIRERGQGVYHVVAHYGFMQTPNVNEIFRASGKKGLKVQSREASFYLGRETLVMTARPGMSRWRKVLFGVMSRNSRAATAFFDIPANRVVELGAHIEL
ncbi:MAG: putative potassium transport system protein kup [Phycisphaerae bacterium]